MRGLLRPFALLLALPILVLLSPILLPLLFMQRGEQRQDARLRRGFRAARIELDGIVTGDDVRGTRCALSWTTFPPGVWSIRQGEPPQEGAGAALFHEADRLRRRDAIVRTIEAVSAEGGVLASGSALLTIRSVVPDETARVALGGGWLGRYAIPEPDTRGGELRTVSIVHEVLDVPLAEARRAVRSGGAIGDARSALSARIVAAQLAEFGIVAEPLPV